MVPVCGPFSVQQKQALSCPSTLGLTSKTTLVCSWLCAGQCSLKMFATSLLHVANIPAPKLRCDPVYFGADKVWEMLDVMVRECVGAFAMTKYFLNFAAMLPCDSWRVRKTVVGSRMVNEREEKRFTDTLVRSSKSAT